MASYNQMKSQGNNGGKGVYNQAGFSAGRGKQNQGQFKSSGCGLLALVVILAVVIILAVIVL